MAELYRVSHDRTPLTAAILKQRDMPHWLKTHNSELVKKTSDCTVAGTDCDISAARNSYVNKRDRKSTAYAGLKTETTSGNRWTMPHRVGHARLNQLPESPEKAPRIVDHVSGKLFMTESADEKENTQRQA